MKDCRQQDCPTPGQRGFSLIELMVAMTLGLILLAGMIAVFEGNRRSSELNTTMANIQENARFALDAIARDTRMSGFQGCLDINNGEMDIIAKAPKFDFRASATTGAVVKADGKLNPAHPLGFVPPDAFPAIPGTHVLVLQFGGAQIAPLKTRMLAGSVPSRSASVVVDGHLDITSKSLAIIADCDVANLFRVSTVTHATNGASTTLTHTANDNDSANLTRSFGSDATIGQTSVSRFLSNTYYIGDTGQTNDRGDPIRALYQQSLPYTATNPPVELVQGVDNLRVSFGMRDGSGLRYVTPDSGSTHFRPERVESIQIGLLMSSFDHISPQNDTRTYALAGQSVKAVANSKTGLSHPGDRRFRLAFNTTVKVRNRRPN